MDFDWTLMRSFLAVIERGSLLGAARALGSSQPTVGRHVAQLEHELGVALFERTGRRLVATRAAHAIAGHAAAMGRSADSIGRALASASAKLEGVVRISASQVAAHCLLPHLVARLQRAEPGIEIEIVATNAISNLLRREADIAVRMVRPAQASLVARRICAIEIGTYAAESYLERRGTPRSPAELLTHDLVGFDTDETIVRGFARLGQAIGRARFRVRSDDHLVAWRAVCAGAGIGFGAVYVAHGEPGIRRLLPDLALPPLTMWLAVHREIRASAIIRRTFDFLATELASEVAARR